MLANFRILGIVTVAVALLAFVPNRTFGDLLLAVLVFTALGGAWNWIGGYAGELALGNGIFFGIGAYSVALSNLRHGLPWFAALGGGVISVIVALVTGFILLSFRGPLFALVTLAAGLAAATLVGPVIAGHATSIAIPVERGFLHLQFDAVWPYALMALVIVVFVQTLTIGLEHTRVGYYLRALRGNPRAARSLGINRRKWALLPFAMSAFVTAIVGALAAQYALAVSPPTDLAPLLSLAAAFVAIVGGRGTVWGAPLGAFVFVIVERVLVAAGVSDWTAVAIVVALGAIAYFALPDGIVGLTRARSARSAGAVA